MTDQHWISDRAGIGVFEEEEYDPGVHLSKYGLTISAQGKTVEYPISRETYEMIRDDFRDLGDER